MRSFAPDGVTRTTRAALKWASYNKPRLLRPYSAIRFFHCSEDAATDGGDLVGWRKAILASATPGTNGHKTVVTIITLRAATADSTGAVVCNKMPLSWPADLNYDAYAKMAEKVLSKL
jgi:hypothetical protein